MSKMRRYASRAIGEIPRMLDPEACGRASISGALPSAVEAVVVAQADLFQNASFSRLRLSSGPAIYLVEAIQLSDHIFRLSRLDETQILEVDNSLSRRDR